MPNISERGEFSRRTFLERMGLTCAVSGAAGLGVPSLAWAAEGGEDSGPIDCGPPPQAKPQHQTGGEGMAPLQGWGGCMGRGVPYAVPFAVESDPCGVGRLGFGSGGVIHKGLHRGQY